VNVGSLLKLSTTFNSVTFAASSAIDLAMRLFSDAAERKLLQQQIDLLKSINSKLDEISKQVASVLASVQALHQDLRPIVADEY
jgi:Ser/Thr protein kinase RdoA (MazF antagonist)